MSKPKDEVRFFRPAMCTRDGLTDLPRRVFHPKRGNHPIRVLDPEGEEVTVRPGESHHWARLLRSGDVVELKSKPRAKADKSASKEK